MFESVQTIHWLNKGPLAIVWTAAQLNRDSELRSKLNRRKCVRVNISEACQILISPEVPLSLCLSSRLLLGIVRIHQRQTHFAFIDSEYLQHHIEVLSGISFDHCQARPDQITFPEPDFNTSFSSASDLHFSKLLSSSPMAGFFQMELEIDGSLILSDFSSSPPPRAGSMKGTPPTELSFTANPKDISIEEGEPEKHLLETSLMESMYFGDEDPMLVASGRNALPDSEAVNHPTQSQPMQQDHVLLFDDLSSSFSYSDGGGAGDISSSVILSPTNPARDTKQTSTVARFESPFVHLKKSQSGVLAPPSTPTNQLATKTDGSLHKLGPRTEDGLDTQKKESRRRKKFCPVDGEISLHRHDMKAGISDVKILTRTVNLRAAKLPKAPEPKDLLFQMYTESDYQLKLSKSLQQPSLVIEKTTVGEFTLDALQPTEPTSSLRTPNMRQNASDTSVSQSIHSELEVARGDSHRDDISYDNPLTNASAISGGDSTIKSSGGHSFHMSTVLRLQTERKDTQDVPPLMTGGLSPIMDMDEEIRDLSGTSIGAMPSLDDSIDYLGRSSSSQHSQLSSPIIERNPTAFADHIMSLLENREQLEFRDLLPKGSTRKTAGIAFHHILTILSNVRELKVEQSTPYGSIIFKCCQSV